jgi:putative ABC transport system substrate-binding protein
LLRQGFSELGWTEGRNIHIDYRWVGGDAARAKANAAELVSQKPDVIIANTTLSLAAVRNETSTIPIVFVSIGDPIGQGFVSSLAHPGGNITGFTAFEFATSAKWLELIKEIVPELRRIRLGEVRRIVARDRDLDVRSSAAGSTWPSCAPSLPSTCATRWWTTSR